MGGCLRKGGKDAAPNKDKQGPLDKKDIANQSNQKLNQSEQKLNQQQQNPGQAQNNEQPGGKKQFSWEKRKRGDLSNFQFVNETEKFLFKLPGSLNGQQFRINKCVDCNIYVHDNHDQCFIDECINCVIVMGPCCSSTFIRNCKNCKVVVTCQQLRLRDCENLEIMIYSNTQPVIESSSKIQFICHQYGYKELIPQMKAAKISIWNNKWNEVFDFTPNNSKKLNYSINTQTLPNFVSSLSQMERLIAQIEKKKGYKIESLKQIEEEDLDAIDLDFDIQLNQVSIPYTLGTSSRQHKYEAMILVFLQQSDLIHCEEILEILQLLQDNLLQENEECWIQETRSVDLTPDQVKELISVQPNPIKSLGKMKYMTVGIHLQSVKIPLEENVTQLLNKSMKKLSINLNFDMQSVNQQAKLIFKTFNIEHTGHNIAQ